MVHLNFVIQPSIILGGESIKMRGVILTALQTIATGCLPSITSPLCFNSRSYLKSLIPVIIIEGWPIELILEVETNL